MSVAVPHQVDVLDEIVVKVAKLEVLSLLTVSWGGNSTRSLEIKWVIVIIRFGEFGFSIGQWRNWHLGYVVLLRLDRSHRSRSLRYVVLHRSVSEADSGRRQWVSLRLTWVIVVSHRVCHRRSVVIGSG